MINYLNYMFTPKPKPEPVDYPFSNWDDFFHVLSTTKTMKVEDQKKMFPNFFNFAMTKINNGECTNFIIKIMEEMLNENCNPQDGLDGIEAHLVSIHGCITAHPETLSRIYDLFEQYGATSKNLPDAGQIEKWEYDASVYND